MLFCHMGVSLTFGEVFCVRWSRPSSGIKVPSKVNNIGCVISREFLCQSSHIPYRSVSQCILLSRSLNRSVLAITIIFEHIHSSNYSSLGAAHAFSVLL